MKKIKKKLIRLAMIAGAVRAYIMLNDLGELTPEEAEIVVEAQRQELNELLHQAGLVR